MVIAALLLSLHNFSSREGEESSEPLEPLQLAEEAMNFFAKKRSSTEEGISGPSQKRYVEYMSKILHREMPIAPTPSLMLQKIIMKPVPNFTMSVSCTPSVQVIDASQFFPIDSIPSER